MSATVIEMELGRKGEEEESCQWLVAGGQKASCQLSVAGCQEASGQSALASCPSDSEGSVPQGLKPRVLLAYDGTAEAVPLQSGELESSTDSEWPKPTRATTAWVGHPALAEFESPHIPKPGICGPPSEEGPELPEEEIDRLSAFLEQDPHEEGRPTAREKRLLAKRKSIEDHIETMVEFGALLDSSKKCVRMQEDGRTYMLAAREAMMRKWLKIRNRKADICRLAGECGAAGVSREPRRSGTSF